MLDFEKNPLVPVDLLSFKITWTEFTIPLISNVSKSSVTSSSAIISWNTDLPSNSSVLYGTTSSLGQYASLNDSVTSHSITLTGLLAGQGYSFRVISCTASSCSQYPQEPYTPDSFTTQSASNPPSGGSGSSGGDGGGGGNYTLKGNYDIGFSKISDIVADPGETRKMSVTVKNTGKGFLNDCILKSRGNNANWVMADGIDDISFGQEQEFIFTLNIPFNTTIGIHPVGLEISCKEFSKNLEFSVELIEKKLGLKLQNVKRQSADELNVLYSLSELSGKNQNVDVNIVLLGRDNERLADFSEIRQLGANSKKDFEAVLKIPSGLKGNYNILINAKSGIASVFVQEDIIIGNPSPLAGFTIFLKSSNSNYLFSALFIIVFFIFVALFLLIIIT
jgi:hypothetical protein